METIPYFLAGVGLLVCAALTAHTFPAFIDIVYTLPPDVQITIGLLSILLLSVFGMLIYALNSRM
jgi:hypothetical protein